MAQSLDICETQEMRIEYEKKELLRQQTLEEQIKVLKGRRDLLLREVNDFQSAEVRVQDQEIHDERESRRIRRDRIRETLIKQQNIEKEIMFLEHQLDQLVLDMRYRRNIEMIEPDNEHEASYSDDDEHVIIDEYFQSTTNVLEWIMKKKRKTHLNTIHQ